MNIELLKSTIIQVSESMTWAIGFEVPEQQIKKKSEEKPKEKKRNPYNDTAVEATLKTFGTIKPRNIRKAYEILDMYLMKKDCIDILMMSEGSDLDNFGKKFGLDFNKIKKGTKLPGRHEKVEVFVAEDEIEYVLPQVAQALNEMFK